jgi:hypothetical protein
MEAYNLEHANQWGELRPAGNIEHETRGALLRIVIAKNWHKDCFRFIPLFDPATIPSPRPGAQFAAARRRRQGRPSRSRPANSDFPRGTLERLPSLTLNAGRKAGHRRPSWGPALPLLVRR